MSGVRIDETGHTYGYLTVIEQAPRNPGEPIMWRCRCRCGNEITISGHDLRHCRAKRSCGCMKETRYRTEKQRTPYLNEIGHVYGKLTVIEHIKLPDDRNAYWRCRCECGNEVTVSTARLRAGKVGSCGCLKKENPGPTVPRRYRVDGVT